VDWEALGLSVRLAAMTALVLLPVGVAVARLLAWQRFRGRGALEALLTVPLVLPPTVLGYYLLWGFDPQAPLGAAWQALSGSSLSFSFTGLLLASIIANLPFAILPMQRAFEAIPANVREAAWCCGLSTWRTLLTVELPLAWPGVLSAMVLTFAHTMGEFGVVLMVGGNIPGETRTLSIAIYDRAQAFDDVAAGTMSAVLLAFSFAVVWSVYLMDAWPRRRRG
jgi:molybdate transport system permease protein